MTNPEDGGCDDNDGQKFMDDFYDDDPEGTAEELLLDTVDFSDVQESAAPGPSPPLPAKCREP